MKEGKDYWISSQIPQRSGYVFQGWSTIKNGGVEYDSGDYIQIKSNLTLYAVWSSAEKEHWASEYIQYIRELGLIDDLGAEGFAPDTNIDRATMIAALYRLSGDVCRQNANYQDVPSNAWYADAVSWAKEHGVANGVSQTEFAPNASITREQMATMLYRYALEAGCVDERGNDSDLTRFSDYSSVNSWAQEAMAWAVSIGLINGRTEKTLVPQGTATRAEAATILKRFNENILAERIAPSECDHIYANGVCEVCGEPCRHFFDVAACWDHDEPGTQKVVRGSGKWEFNSSAHWVISQTYKCVCTQCGSEIYTDVAYDDDEVWASRTSHSFKYKQYDESSHSIHCACGYMGYAAHSFENGVCKYCGYERINESVASSVADSIQRVLNGAMFSDAADYPFAIYEDYANSNGGTALYACLIVDNAMNLSDLRYLAESSGVGFDETNLDLARDIRSLAKIIDSMDARYYVESFDEAASFFDWILEGLKKTTGFDKSGYDAIADFYDSLEETIEFESEISASVANGILKAIDDMPKADKKALIRAYEIAMDRHVNFEKWLQGMSKVSEVMKKVDGVMDIIKDAQAAFYIFGDYSEALDKLAILKKATENSNDRNLPKAIAFHEKQYNSTLLRALEYAEQKGWEKMEDAFGVVWAGVKLALLPVSGIASACVMFESVTETKNGLAVYAQSLLAKKQRGENVDESELREVLHALVDIRLYSCDLAMKLTWNGGSRDSLRTLKGKMQNWHQQIDDLVDIWFGS